MLFFFFQAEDGIRDLVRSRGLGDVYKRQGEYVAVVDTGSEHLLKKIRVGSSPTGLALHPDGRLSLIHI